MEGLQQLLVDELQDLYDAEKQLVRALPKLAKTASDEELSKAFQEHLEVTKGQVQRLEQIFEGMEMRAKSKPCAAMKGLVEEAQEMMQEDHAEPVLDAGLIGCARRVEHYEMSGYESARAIAMQLGLKEAAQLLQETMREEVEADKLLGQIAKRVLKEGASMQSASEEEEQPARGGRSQGKSKSAKSSAGAQAKGGSRGRSQGRSGTQGKSQGRGKSGASAEPLTDHEQIRQWAEERNGVPSCVRGTGEEGDIGMLRLNFPGYSGEDSLQEISWDDWFEKFDERNLALIVQEKTARGQKSNFNKLITREAAARPKTRTAS